MSKKLLLPRTALPNIFKRSASVRVQPTKQKELLLKGWRLTPEQFKTMNGRDILWTRFLGELMNARYSEEGWSISTYYLNKHVDEFIKEIDELGWKARFRHSEEREALDAMNNGMIYIDPIDKERSRD